MIGFRVDANEKIATGHLMRCITIALECMRKGKKCMFYLAEDKETERLAELEIPYRILGSKWDDMETEITLLRNLVETDKLEWLVVDSYQVTRRYLELLQEKVPVLYMDDMGKDTYPISAIVHYTQWEDDDSFSGKYEKTTVTTLWGMRYIPLRKEFTQVSSLKKQFEREESILITTGGTDTYNITGKLLQEISKYKELQNFRYQVIVGNMNENEEFLRKLAEQDGRIKLHKNIKNMGDFMKACEVAVSAGGTTLFELCALGTPTVCFSFAENQETFAKEMGRRKIMQYAGDARYDEEIAGNICKKLLEFVTDKSLREGYSERMKQLVDGKGAERIASFLADKIKK